MKNNLYVIILAGGKGERLWPLSRSKKPKQLLPFGKNQSLLDEAIQRASDLVPSQNILIVTTQELSATVHDVVGEKVGQIIAEPISRNTAPAIALAALKIYKTDPDATLVFLSADHYIPDCSEFIKSLEQCAEFAQTHNGIVLIGLKPILPATGYGYIEYQNDNNNIHKVARFHEKPSMQNAQKYLTQSNMLWNIGVFCARVQVFLNSLRKHAPEVFGSVDAFIRGDQNAYAQAPKISIDYAVLEKSNEVYVLPASFEWSDVGNLETFLSLQQAAQATDIITLDAHRNLVSAQVPVVALIGVDNLCIVQTDDVLLIVKRQDAERVKEVVQKLQKKGGDAYL